MFISSYPLCADLLWHKCELKHRNVEQNRDLSILTDFR